MKRTIKSITVFIAFCILIFGLLPKVPALKNQLDAFKDSVVDQAGQDNATAVGSAAILKQLVVITDKQSPGPTKNYYWNNGKSKLDRDKMPAKGKVKFAFDSKGRSGIARASLTYSMYAESKGSRQGSPLDPPSWPSKNPKTSISYKLTGRTYNGYMWNRSHSVGDSLAGAQSYDSAANFTTGTRPQNVGADQNGGMRAAEETVEDYWKSHTGSKTTVWYQVSPLYNKSETMPRGSVIDISSSDGKLNRELVVINSAEGHDINYKNATFVSNQ